MYKKNGSDNLSYIKYSDDEILRVGQLSISDLLIKQGETLRKSGSEMEWNYSGQKISIRGNYWYNHYELIGGNTISFVMKYMNMSFREAVAFLLGTDIRQIIYVPEKKKQKKVLKLPKANSRMKRTYKYLCDYRKISPYIVSFFANRNKIYEDVSYHNIVFVGYDKKGIPKHAHLKGSYPGNKFKGTCAGSEPEYSFHHIGANEDIYLFESPVDMLSYMTMHYGENNGSSYAASCSVSDRVLFQCLEDYPHIKNVFLCFDNDKAGQEANERIREKLLDMEYNVKILIPKLKDWNEDLMKEGENKCQTME